MKLKWKYMINSLSKDSHITRQKSSAHTQNSPSSVQKRPYATVASNHINFNTDQYKPAQISFSGFSCAKNLENFGTYPLRQLLNSAKNFIAKDEALNSADLKTVNKSTKDLIAKVVESFQNPGQKADEAVEKFLLDENNTKNAKTLLDDAKLVIKHSDDKNAIDYASREYKESEKGFINEAVDVLHSAENPGKIFTSKKVQKFLEMAEKKQPVFSAFYAAALACVLRPLTIVGLPGKKNKSDKQYASSHSISSGLIGYAVAVVISSPIAAGIKKIATEPKKYLSDDVVDFFKNIKPGRVVNEAIKLEDTRRFGIARQYLNMVPELLLAVPRAVITIALIPPILKYVFGLEKKSHHAPKDANINQQSYAFGNFKAASEPVRKVFQNFMGESK